MSLEIDFKAFGGDDEPAWESIPKLIAEILSRGLRADTS
jgi:hypothetical protein